MNWIELQLQIGQADLNSYRQPGLDIQSQPQVSSSVCSTLTAASAHQGIQSPQPAAQLWFCSSAFLDRFELILVN